MLALWVPPWILDRVRNSAPGMCYWDPSLNTEFVFIVASLGHHGPFCIMIFCYTYVFIFMRKRAKVASMTANSVAPASAANDSNVKFYSHGAPAAKQSNALSTDTKVSTISPQLSHTNSNSQVSSTANPGSNYQVTLSANDPKPQDLSSQATKVSRFVKERRVFVTLTYIIIGYAILWLPFHIVFDVSIVDPSLVPEQVLNLAFWMAYFNSTINPFLYNFSSPEFRRTFIRILSRKIC